MLTARLREDDGALLAPGSPRRGEGEGEREGDSLLAPQRLVTRAAARPRRVPLLPDAVWLWSIVLLLVPPFSFYNLKDIGVPLEETILAESFGELSIVNWGAFPKKKKKKR